MTVIRFVNTHGHDFRLPDPVVVETALSGPCFRTVDYSRVRRDGSIDHVPFTGDFRLRDAVLIEPVEEQLEMQTVAA